MDSRCSETPCFRETPYFSQWETPGLTAAVLAEGEAALLRDPAWASSGAASLDEYATWAGHVCGMACLKMVLAARGQVLPTLQLARDCSAYGGYVVEEDGGAIRGLIYAPFVRYIADAFGLRASIVLDIEAADLPDIMDDAAFFVASVHPDIRWPDRTPPSTGGHLVLVLAANERTVTFHNPSGHDRSSQANVVLPLSNFGTFFAGRGIRIER